MKLLRRSIATRRMVFVLSLVAVAGSTLAGSVGHYAEPHAGLLTHLLAGHNEPDPSLHLEPVVGEHSLFCPGCMLERQLGGSHLQHVATSEPPVVAPESPARSHVAPFGRVSSPRSSRGPPSC